MRGNEWRSALSFCIFHSAKSESGSQLRLCIPGTREPAAGFQTGWTARPDTHRPDSHPSERIDRISRQGELRPAMAYPALLRDLRQSWKPREPFRGPAAIIKATTPRPGLAYLNEECCGIAGDRRYPDGERHATMNDKIELTTCYWEPERVRLPRVELLRSLYSSTPHIRVLRSNGPGVNAGSRNEFDVLEVFPAFRWASWFARDEQGKG